MRHAPRRLALLVTAALAASVAAAGAADAQDAIVLTGTIEQSYGEDGFVMTVGGEEVAVATGQLFDDNPRLRLSEGDTVTVYGAPDGGFFTDRILDADGVRIGASGRVTRVSDSELDDAVYGERRRSPRQALSERSERSRGQDRAEERRAARGPDERRRAAGRAGPSEEEDFDEFESYDRNGDGVVTLEEYVRIAARPSNVTRAEANRLFEVLARGDRRMTKREYLNPSPRYERLSERFLSN